MLDMMSGTREMAIPWTIGDSSCIIVTKSGLR
jgi:hypothetical protein